MNTIYIWHNYTYPYVYINTPTDKKHIFIQIHICMYTNNINYLSWIKLFLTLCSKAFILFAFLVKSSKLFHTEELI